MKVYVLVLEHVYLTGPFSGWFVENLVEALPAEVYNQEDLNQLYNSLSYYNNQGRQISIRMILRQAIDPSFMVIQYHPDKKLEDVPVAEPDIPTDYTRDEAWEK